MYIILYKSHSPCNKFNSVSSSSSENIMTARISSLLFNHCPKGYLYSFTISGASTVVYTSRLNNSC